MLNWFRWAPKGQIAFLAPTKPLVAQQIDACYNIAGIPRSQTALVTGEVKIADRQDYWQERRVFFSTPQTMHNDISKGLCDPTKLVCLVIDEAHKTSGRHAYAEVVKSIRKYNTSFRILALTATPGSTVEAVQNVIDTLGIAHVEIRSDESIDIAPYINSRTVDEVILDLPPELEEVRDLYCLCLQPLLKKLNNAQVRYITEPERLTTYGLMQQKSQFMASEAGRAMAHSSKGFYWSIMKIFTQLMRLSHPLTILSTHGLRVFYAKLQNPADSVDKNDTETVDKSAIAPLRKDPNFNKLIDRCDEILADLNYPSHPKMDRMVTAMLQHFATVDSEETKRETRIIVFASFRDSAEEITRYLKRHEPLIKPSVFVGQSTKSTTSAGMNQKTQMDIVAKFKSGVYNTLVATCIGEEGLDIGEVDMIICFDTSQSPIRLIQRMGRTGRKRSGHAMILLTAGREADSYRKAIDNGKFMQRKIECGSEFTYPFEMSPRILPRGIDPRPLEQFIEIPPENSQPEPPKRRRGPPKKKPEKRFFMPEGAETGFTTAGSLHDPTKPPKPAKAKATKATKTTKPTKARKPSSPSPEPQPPSSPLAAPPDPASVFLTDTELATLRRGYQSTSITSPAFIQPPNLSAHPATQRTLTAARIPHSRLTLRTVDTLNKIHAMTPERAAQLAANYDPAVIKPPAPSALGKTSGNHSPTSSSPQAKKRKPTRADSSAEPELPKPKPKPRGKAAAKPRKQAPKRVALSSSDDDEPVPKKRKPVVLDLSESDEAPRRKVLRKEAAADGDSDSSEPDIRGVVMGFRTAAGKKW